MRMSILASAIVLATATVADAGWLRSNLFRTHQRQTVTVRTRTVATTAAVNINAAAPHCPVCAAARPPVAIQSAAAVAPAVGGVIAQAKAQDQANAGTGKSFHTGNVPAGCVEGVGYSSSSAAQALANCCYSNSGLRLREQGVAFGRGGWYACRIFWK